MKTLLAFILLAASCFAQNQTVSGGTTGGNIYPASTGQKLGTTGQRWDVYAQNVDVAGGGTMFMSNAGVFTNGQMNDYFTSLVGGLSTTTEFQAGQGANAATEGLVGGVTCSGTVHQCNGVSGYATTANAGDTGFAVGGYFQARALANSGWAWGANPIATDATGLTANLSLLGVEVDAGPQNATSAYAGVFGVTAAIGGTASSWADNTTVGGSTAFYASRNANSRWWDYGFRTNDNTVVTAAVLSGAKGCDGTASSTCDSQGIDFDAYSSGTKKSARITELSNGNLAMSPGSGGVVSISSALNMNAQGITSAGAIAGATTIGMSGQLTSTLVTGTAPLVIASTTPVANLNTAPVTYNAGGTQQANAHIVTDHCTIGTNCAVTLAGSAAFSSAYKCGLSNETNANPAKIVYNSVSQFTITGTASDVISFVCVGN